MPVTAEREQEKPARRSRGWLWGPLGLLALVLLLLAVPLFRPVSGRPGGYVVLTGTERIPSGGLPTPRRLFYSFDNPPPPAGVNAMTMLPDGRQYRLEGDQHARLVVIADRAYYVTWFKGRRVK